MDTLPAWQQITFEGAAAFCARKPALAAFAMRGRAAWERGHADITQQFPHMENDDLKDWPKDSLRGTLHGLKGAAGSLPTMCRLRLGSECSGLSLLLYGSRGVCGPLDADFFSVLIRKVFDLSELLMTLWAEFTDRSDALIMAGVAG